MAKPASRKWISLGGLLFACALAFALALWGVRGVADPAPPGPRDEVGLVTSLPLYWPDGIEFDALTQGEVELPWVRQKLEERYELLPLDTLTTGDEGAVSPQLAQLQYLAVIQPRGLSPADNVALDRWVSDGGHLLLALDPMLMGHYAYSVFDPRHPVSSALIPPVVTRWGLAVTFDDTQPLAPRVVDIGGTEIPLVMAGELSLLDDGTGECELRAEAALAVCEIGKGRAVLLADATAFEAHDDGEGSAAALLALLGLAFE